MQGSCNAQNPMCLPCAFVWSCVHCLWSTKNLLSSTSQVVLAASTVLLTLALPLCCAPLSSPRRRWQEVNDDRLGLTDHPAPLPRLLHVISAYPLHLPRAKRRTLPGASESASSSVSKQGAQCEMQRVHHSVQLLMKPQCTNS